MAGVILEQHRISPPVNASSGAEEQPANEFSLLMVFFDMLWYKNTPNLIVLFYEFPCSKTHFLETIVPNMRKSLSLTLAHFLPFAGNIIHPINPRLDQKPVLRYVNGDSISFTVCESKANLSHLAGNHPRCCDEVFSLVPHELPPTRQTEVAIECPVLAFQVTLFPEQGISIGFALHHAAGDLVTILLFLQAWGLINRAISGGDRELTNHSTKTMLMQANLLPSYDRKTVVGLDGMDSVFWNAIVKNGFSPVDPRSPPLEFPAGYIRTTLILKSEEIQGLKKHLAARVSHLSSFVVTCAFIWICTAKSAAPGGENVADDEPEYFRFWADCRGRLNPPLPANYFGNCLASIVVELKHAELKGKYGFQKAAESIGKAIRERVYGDKGVTDGAENWLEYKKLEQKRQLFVPGSAKFDMYKVDFGWGKSRKYENLPANAERSMSLSMSGDSVGGFEIRLCKPKARMEAFLTTYSKLLADLTESRSRI